MRLVVLSILRVDKEQKEEKIALYAGLSSNKHIYGKLMSVNCDWPTYVRIKRSTTDVCLDKTGSGTLVRKLFVEDSKPMEFSKKFSQMVAGNPDDLPFIEAVDKVVSAVQFVIENRSE